MQIVENKQVLPRPSHPNVELSYKFQRLREKIRGAITAGELSGKLPGERELARRFHCNAKTLSKALTDLAAEGVLDRSIGRGTFVKGETPAQKSRVGSWLIVCNPHQQASPVIAGLLHANPVARVETGELSTRPSFVNQFTSVIDFTGRLPDAFSRDLILRNISTVLVDHEPRTYATHAVLTERSLGATHLARKLLLNGHRRLCAVEARGSTLIADALRQVVSRFALGASVDSCAPDEIAAAIEAGLTAVLCDSAQSARTVMAAAGRLGVPVPSQLAVCAVGVAGRDHEPCTGYFVSESQQCQAILELLRIPPTQRPATLWLVPAFADCGTIDVDYALDDRSLAAVVGLPEVSVS